jgi:hypothetical protein
MPAYHPATLSHDPSLAALDLPSPVRGTVGQPRCGARGAASTRERSGP